jgi:hypothetical protein
MQKYQVDLNQCGPMVLDALIKIKVSIHEGFANSRTSKIQHSHSVVPAERESVVHARISLFLSF